MNKERMIPLPDYARAFIDTYEVGAIPHLACQQNAFRALVKVAAKEPDLQVEELPRIWLLKIGSDFHSYLVWQDQAYCFGVTWPTAEFPEMTKKEVEESGEDVTMDLLDHMFFGMEAEIAKAAGAKENTAEEQLASFYLFQLLQETCLKDLTPHESQVTLFKLEEYLSFLEENQEKTNINEEF